MDDKQKYQYEGLKWLYEMEILDDPQLINNLKLNIMDATEFKVKDVEFVMAQSQQKMLIYVKLGWFNRKFKSKGIFIQIQERVTQLLPNFQFRIVTNRSILELAITKLKESLVGGTYAVSTNANSSDINDTSTSKGKESGVSKTPDILPDQAEQTHDEKQESVPIVESDSSSDSETQDPS